MITSGSALCGTTFVLVARNHDKRPGGRLYRLRLAVRLRLVMRPD